MCGIFAFYSLVERTDAKDILDRGLRSIQHRGHNSWGIATSKNKQHHGEIFDTQDTKASMVEVGDFVVMGSEGFINTRTVIKKLFTAEEMAKSKQDFIRAQRKK